MIEACGVVCGSLVEYAVAAWLGMSVILVALIGSVAGLTELRPWDVLLFSVAWPFIVVFAAARTVTS